MTHAFPDSDVFYRRLDREFPLAVSARGCTIVDEDGREYLDASGGAMVANVGHGAGHVDGERGDLIMLAPPFTIGEDEIREIATRLGAALGDLE